MGDHGMCDVSRHLDLMGRVADLGLRIPADVVPFYDSTMARFRIRKSDAGHRLKNFLSGFDGGRLLDHEKAEQLGVNFPDGRFGDLVFLVDCGTMIVPSFMGVKGVAAMHGYHPGNSCMYSALFSNYETDTQPRFLEQVAGYLLPGFAEERGE